LIQLELILQTQHPLKEERVNVLFMLSFLIDHNVFNKSGKRRGNEDVPEWRL